MLETKLQELITSINQLTEAIKTGGQPAIEPAASAIPTAPEPVPTVQPATQPPVNTAPASVPTTAPVYTLDAISRAGAALVDAGKMDALLDLLKRYNVQAVTQLDPSQYGAFATELRALGAQL